MSVFPPRDAVAPWSPLGRPGVPRLEMAPDEGRVSRRIFTDPHIFEMELEEIFARAWFFVAHESELPNPGDMVSRPVGADRAVVVRDDNGQLRVFLNSCRHRGMRLCRTDRANGRFLRCPYHGWTYGNDGSLVLVPTEDHYEAGELDKGRLGLIPVGGLAVHQGLIFATWDPGAPPLSEYLGDMGFYLDIIFGRTNGGIEIVGSPQVWEVETGWKFATDNFTDNFHVFQTHHSLVELGLLPPDPDFAAGGNMVVAGNGHVMHFTEGPPTDEFRGFGLPRELRDQFPANLTPDQVQVIERSGLSAGTVWPNFHWLQLLVQSDPGLPITPVLNLRLEEPVSPTRTRMWSWFAVDRTADGDFRRASYETYVRTLGPSGIFDQDDMENWEDCTRVNVGPVAKRFDLHHGMGIGRAVDTAWPGPGTAYAGAYGEMTQRSWYGEWWRRMSPHLHDAAGHPVSAAAHAALDERLLPGGALHGRVVHFYNVEADLLDSHRYADWFEFLHPEISYEMPVRTTELLAVGDGVSEMAFFSENWSSMDTRVRRLQTGFAWAETPPSRTRHFVTNVMIMEAGDDGVLRVQSNVLVNRTRGDGGNQTLTAIRRDELVPEPAKVFVIRKRYLLLDQTVLAATNLGVFL